MFIKEFCLKYNLNWQFVKFLLVGGLNTLFGYSVFALFTFLRFHYSAATFLATILGILFNFKTTGCIVFKNSNNRLIFKFVAVYGFVYLLTVGALKLMLLSGMKNMYLNYLILLFPNALLSFYLMKRFTFSEKKDYSSSD